MNAEPFCPTLIRASAGSGKTHQLTNRYLGLVAAGVDPDSILATTFTRKAAGEILGRVLGRLAKAADDESEANELAKQLGKSHALPSEFVSLLRRMTKNLHRVRIGTLDSFFMVLAGSFSLELGLPAAWSICEVTDDAALREQALESLLEREEADILISLYNQITQGETKRGVRSELMQIVSDLYEIQRETPPSIWDQIVVAKGLTKEKLQQRLAQLAEFDLADNARMQTARDGDCQRAELEDWKGFFTKGLSGKIFAGEAKYHSKQIPDQLTDLYKSVIAHAGGVLLQQLANRTKATREFLDRFHREMWALKQETGQLRFDEVTGALADGIRRRLVHAGGLEFRLDSAIEHVLLDEFQDTSLPQWRVLAPIAGRVVAASADAKRSFFCVGDVKQAIYGWRGGMPEILELGPQSLGQLREEQLVESRRSVQPVIDVVNKVFGKLSKTDMPEKLKDGLAAWNHRFDTHVTKIDKPGYACLHAGPAQEKDEKVGDQRGRQCQYVAGQIRDFVKKIGACTVGVLCRKNDTVARMIYELREKNIAASEEGGNPLTDSAAVEVVLSLFTLADHPGNSIAWFHLQNSPLKNDLQSFASPDALANALRREILADGYGPFTHKWAIRLASACNRRELSRLEQLIETAYDYQARSTLRADDFAALVRQQRKPDSSAANVRVMTIHAAKGLQFDVVVLPELDTGLLGQAPAFVVGRKAGSLDANFVCRYADETVQSLLPDDQQSAFVLDRRQRVEESLSLLYVAVTRAAHALHLFIPGPRQGKSNRKDAWHHLLMQTLAPDVAWTECAELAQFGNPQWFETAVTGTVEPAVAARAPQRQIAFRPPTSERRRGLEQVAPSSREGKARIVMTRLFNPSEGTGMAAGTLFHAWFEAIEWLDDGEPGDEILHEVTQKLRTELPSETWSGLDDMLRQFRAWLKNPNVRCVLQRSAYVDPKQPGFPIALGPIWSNAVTPEKVENERRFLVRDGKKMWNGSIDRIVWLGDGQKLVAADVIDFKTDDIPPGDTRAIDERTEHYRPQVEAYRQAVARFAGLPAERIAARLVFAKAGCVRHV